jgi:hypothetical protein
MRSKSTWPLGLLLTGCFQDDYSFSVDNDVITPVGDTSTDSGPFVWDDCGIQVEPSSEVPVDHTCVDGEELAIDLKVKVTDVCFPACEEGAPVFVALQITNQGGVDHSGSIPLAIYGGAAGAGIGDVPLAVYTHTGGLAAGQVAQGVVVEFEVSALEGRAIRVEVNDDGTGEWAVAECSLNNNRDVWDAVPCLE